MNRSHACLLIVVLLSGAWAGTASAVVFSGYAAMGASETQGTAYTGSWVPYLANQRGLNFGGANQPYNVAVSGATSVTLLSQGQHTTVANLVTAGSVDLSYLTIGGNDFNAVASQLISGTLVGPALTTWANGVVTNINTAMDTVLAANPDGMVVVSMPDILLTPGGRAAFTTAEQKQRGTNAVNLVNSLLKPQVLTRGLVYVDLAKTMRDIDASPLVVGGVTINVVTGNSNPTYLFQDSLHPAAVGNGLLANLFMSAANIGYGTTTALLTDSEILTTATLGSSYTGETSQLIYANYLTKVVLLANGDLNLDGIVNILDLASVAKYWLTPNPLGDANRDGFVNIQDVAFVATHWLEQPAPGGGGSVAAVPEPGSMALLLVGACVAAGARLSGRRRRGTATARPRRETNR